MFQVLQYPATRGASNRGVFVLVSTQRKFQRQYIVGIKSRRNLLQADKAAEQQPGHNEYNHGDGKFGDDEQAAQIVAASPHGACAGGTSVRIFQRGEQVNARDTQCRSQAEQDARSDGNQQRKEKSVTTDANLIQTRNTSGTKHMRPMDADESKKHAQDSAAKRK